MFVLFICTSMCGGQVICCNIASCFICHATNYANQPVFDIARTLFETDCRHDYTACLYKFK